MAQVLPKHRAREYETIFIMHPEVPADTIDQVAGRVTDVVDKLSGKLIRVENWGKRRLAYNVKKQNKGVYIYLRYLGYSDIVSEMERVLRMLEPVLKYLTVKVEEDVNPEARPIEDISFNPSYPEESEVKEAKAPAETPAAEAPAEDKAAKEAPKAAEEAPKAAEEAPKPAKPVEEAPKPAKPVEEAPKPAKPVEEAPKPAKAVEEVPKPAKAEPVAETPAPEPKPEAEAPAAEEPAADTPKKDEE